MGRSPSAETALFYHGASSASLELARSCGELRPRCPREIAGQIEDAFGLDRDAVFNHPCFEFSRTRSGDRSIYVSRSPEIATRYARVRGELIDDALRAAFQILNPPSGWGQHSPEVQRYRQELDFFRRDYFERSCLLPVLLTLAAPIELIARSSNYRNYCAQQSGEPLDVPAWLALFSDEGCASPVTLMLPAPVPFDLVVCARHV